MRKLSHFLSGLASVLGGRGVTGRIGGGRGLLSCVAANTRAVLPPGKRSKKPSQFTVSQKPLNGFPIGRLRTIQWGLEVRRLGNG